MRAVRGALRRLRVDWEAGLGRLPFFTQRTAVLLLGVLVATLAMLGGVVALVGWPRAGGPTHLVPGERAGRSRGQGSGGGPVRGRRRRRDGGFPVPSARRRRRGGLPVLGGRRPVRPRRRVGGPPAAPPTTSPPTTTPGLLDPVEELLGPVVSTLVP